MHLIFNKSILPIGVSKKIRQNMDIPRGKNLVTEIIEILEFSENEMHRINGLMKSESRSKKDSKNECSIVEHEVIDVLDQVNLRLRVFMASMITSPMNGRLFLPPLSTCVEHQEVNESIREQLYLQKVNDMEVYQ